ncbi:MAG: hypothetical protein AB1791_11285 [Chloroflexota bacterium]
MSRPSRVAIIGVCLLLLGAAVVLPPVLSSSATATLVGVEIFLPTVWRSLPPAPIEPYAGAPPCDTHPDTEWHSLWNYTMGCHYDHEHNDDPHSVDDILGPVGELYGGQSISYPWQTFVGSGEDYPPAPEPGQGLLENEAKHGAYGWLVRRDVPTCTAAIAPCIHDARVAFHALMSAHDAVVRYHSGFVEVRILNTDGTYGIAKLGGWYDHNCLEVDQVFIPLPGDPPEGCLDDGHGRRQHSSIYKVVHWYAHQNFRDQAVVSRVGVATTDPWGPINPADPYLLQFFCANYLCAENNSTMSLNELTVRFFDDLDTNGDDRLDGSYWTDRYGILVANCAQPALDCVPLSFDNVPIARMEYHDEDNGLPGAGAIEYDLSPEGEFWIEYEN